MPRVALTRSPWFGRFTWRPAWRVTDDVPGYPRWFHAYWLGWQLTVRLR